MLVSHKTSLVTTKADEEYFRRASGTARFAYNWALDKWDEFYKAGVKVNEKILRKELNKIKKEDFPWMLEVTKCAPQQAIKNLGKAYSNYFKSLKKSSKLKAQKPTKKKKGKAKNSFYIDNGHFSIDNDNQTITIPKLGTVKMAEKLRHEGKIMSAIVSEKAGKWFVSVSVDVDNLDVNKAPKGSSVGIDLGIKTALTLSTGKTYHSPKPLKKYEKKLKKAQRNLSKKKKGSKNRLKAKQKLAKVHAKIANIRQDFIHKTTTAIANRYETIIVEDLNVKGMMANHKLAKSISDISFFEITRQLEYKALDREGRFEKINRFFPSSKECRKCKTKNTNLKLSDRFFVCINKNCNHTEERDLHAGKNIHGEGLSVIKIRKNTESHSGINDCGQMTSTFHRKMKSKLAGGNSKAKGDLANVKSKEIVDTGDI